MFSNAIMLYRGEWISENKIEPSQNYKMAADKGLHNYESIL